MSITFNNRVYATGFVGEDDGAPSAGFGIDAASTNSITINGTVNAVGDSVTATGLLPGSADTGNTNTTNTLYVTTYENSGMIEFSLSPPASQTRDSFRFVLSNTTLAAGQRVTFNNDPTLSQYQPVCFATGTLIRTSRGDVAVEDLRVGDLAVTAAGSSRPIVWIGHRTIECGRHPHLNEVLPVQIAAHAFGENRPSRDLVVSPGHSIAVDLIGEVLIPASSLVNGTTIRQLDVERVTYWHVELETHDLLLSENLPTESYLEVGNRAFFLHAGEATALHGVPDAPASVAAQAGFCRPHHAAGPMVDFVRDRLAARALQLSWTAVEHPLADMHLVVDGQRIEPEVHGLTARFLVPATAEAMWLVSDTVVPAMVGGGADLRSLGVCVGKLIVDDGFGAQQVVAADDPRLCVGFHYVEQGPQRWTAGRARLPSELWEGCRGSFFLRVELTRPSLPRWSKAGAEIAADDVLALAS